jgi:hypothetical protein
MRAAFLLILALTVATGESAALMCQTVCDRRAETDADACHGAPSAARISITNGADCRSIGLPATATPRVELNRTDSDAATPIGVSNGPVMMALGRAFAPPVLYVCVGSPPRTIALRI